MTGFLSIFILDPIGKVRYNRNVHTYNNILIDLTVNIVLSFDRAILNFDCFKCKQFIIFFILFLSRSIVKLPIIILCFLTIKVDYIIY